MVESEARPTVAFFNEISLDVSEVGLQLDEEELKFLQTATGITDAKELNHHIIDRAREAFALKPYPCIANFNFTDLNLARHPMYNRLLDLGRSRENPIYLEIGCCFGQDLRKAILDGYPQESVIATDIVPEFWGMGHKMFRTNADTFPVPFVSGDLFDPAFLETVSPFYSKLPAAPPKLSEVKTLSELRGHISVITILHVFHVFDTEEAQLRMARALGCLLSPEPGSMIIGIQTGKKEKGITKGFAINMFSHTPESWTDMWDGQVFEKGTVKVETELVPRVRRSVKDGKVVLAPREILRWTVTRL